MRGGVCPRCLITNALAGDDLEEENAPAQLGDYDLIEEIARGGMGVVWRARQRRLNRMVALKLLRDSSLPGEAGARRFRIEAEAAAALRHPHIVSVYEVGEVGGRWFLSMELLAGSLAGKGPLPPRTAAELIAKIARAVQHAHDRGILHRDLKPANVLLDEAGEPRVADFGLARFAEQDSTITVSGSVIGTPAYMSPEQAAGQELTTASDVYSLGAIFYELLAGRPPFQADAPLEMMRKLSDTDPGRLPTAPRDLEVIALKCLEKNPATRYSSALALAEDVERWLRGEPILARLATVRERLWKWARRRPALAALWVLATLVLVGIGVGGTLYAMRLERERTAALHGLARQHAQGALALAESGEWHRALLSLAEAIEIGTGDAARDRNNRLRFECIVRQSPRLVMFSGEAPRHAQFTADSTALLFVHERYARLYDAATGAPLGPPLSHDLVLVAADANADGTRVVCGTEDGKWTLWDARAGTVVAHGEGRLHGLPPPDASRPAAIFGGDRFVVTQGDKAQCILAADGLPAGVPIQRRAPIRWAVLTPDGANVYTFSEENLLRPGPDLADGTGPQFLCRPSTEISHFLMGKDRIDALQADDGWCCILRWPDNAPIRDGHIGKRVFAQTFRRSANWVALAPSLRGVNLVDGWSPVIPQLLEHGASGIAGTFDDAGLAALTLASDGSAQQWELADDRPHGPRLRIVGTPVGVALSGDGKSALVRSSAAVWLWRQRAPVAAEAAPDSAPPPGRSADGRFAVRIAPDATVLLYDARSGAVLFPPLRHPAPVESAGFSPDGALLVTRAAGAVRVWETATGHPVAPPIIHAGLAEARWNADSATLFTRGEGGWRADDLSPGARPLAEMKSLARLLSAHRLVPGSDHGLIALSVEELRAAWETAGAAQIK